MHKNYKYISLSLLFLALIVVKLSAFHVYMHDCSDDTHIENCSFCEDAIANMQTEFSEAEILTTPIKKVQRIFFKPPTVVTVNIFLSENIHYSLHNRPPPFLG